MENIIYASGLCFMDLINYPEIQIEENCTTFISGKSGCGKSTLFKLLNATLSPSKGTIFFRNKDIEELNPIEYRRKVLLASQDAYLFDGTIMENFQLYYESRETKLINENEIKEALSLCCADISLETQCSILSGGERQRVFLAICLSFNPEVILLDEPTSALDGNTAMTVLENIIKHCRQNNITPVIVCHDRKLVDYFADKIIEL